MAEAHVKELIEINPNPTLEEEAAALDAVATPVEEVTPAIPEKFVKDGKPDYEALAKAYKELEKKQSGKATESGKKDEEEEDTNDEAEGEAPKPTDEETPPSEDEARDTAESAGVDYDALTAEYLESGKLADSSYDTLEKAGIPRGLVDQYIAGQEAIQSETRSAVFNSVGGEAVYNDMLGWAADNLSEAEIDAYNTAVNSGNMNQTTLAVKGLKARYQADEGQEPTVRLGGNAVSEAVGYKSWAQVTKAMNDPRYAKDPAYIAEVEAKIAASGNLL